jgi:polyisoprenoid-binding protein YceI
MVAMQPEPPMIRLTRRATMTGLAALLGAACRPARAAPKRYALDPDGSSVGFVFYLSGAAVEGTMPVTRADLIVDPENLARSAVDVSVSVAEARTPFIFATTALKSAEVLDAARHPEVRFVSTAIRLGEGGRISDGARIAGNVTVRGVTRPLTLDAALYRRQGSAVDDLSRLTTQLQGHIDRSDFGATGYPDLVANRVDLDIRAAIRAVE